MPAFGHGWWWRGLLSYLVAIGAGAMVQVHSILATRSVVLAWAGEAGIALGHNVDVHWAWAAKPPCVSTRSSRELTVIPPVPSALACPSASCQPRPVSTHGGQLVLQPAHPVQLECH